jgi:hypothetical protein
MTGLRFFDGIEIRVEPDFSLNILNKGATVIIPRHQALEYLALLPEKINVSNLATAYGWTRTHKAHSPQKTEEHQLLCSIVEALSSVNSSVLYQGRVLTPQGILKVQQGI